MTSPPDDADLRASFSRLREEERGRAPDFRRAWAAARSRRRPRRRSPLLAVAASAAGLAALAGIFGLAVLGERWLASGPPGRATSPPTALADWRSPTDFLLETPGQDLLHTPQRLGAPRLDQDLGIERKTP